MGSGDDSCKFTLVIFPKTDSQNETDPLKKYITFATNIPKGDILRNIRGSLKTTGWGGDWRPDTLVSDYSERGPRAGITPLRLLYFYYSLILYNACLIANLILASRFNVFHLIKEPIIRLQLLKDFFHRITVESILIESYGLCYGGGGNPRSGQTTDASRSDVGHNPI